MKKINLPDNIKFILVFSISVLLFTFSEFNKSNYAHPKFELGFFNFNFNNWNNFNSILFKK